MTGTVALIRYRSQSGRRDARQEGCIQMGILGCVVKNEKVGDMMDLRPVSLRITCLSHTVLFTIIIIILRDRNFLTFSCWFQVRFKMIK